MSGGEGGAPHDSSIYQRWGLRPIINASGAVTRLGGAPMPPAVLDAFRAAASESVPLDQLQGAASRVIGELTGAEAGLVTSGAAAALTLGTAAILTGWDLGRMERLPCCDGFPCEILVAREQRNGYDHAVRAAGARLGEVGFQERWAGAGVRAAEVWEYEVARGPLTAGILYVQTPQAEPPLAELVIWAHRHGLPVLVDAAGELPPRAQLRSLLATGADLVAFSGGKAIRGPQATGILCGRRELVGAAALQMLDMDDHFSLWDPPESLFDKRRLPGLPRQGIGRGMKVAKEQIVALLVALEQFAAGAYDAEVPPARDLLRQLGEALRDLPVVSRLVDRGDGQTLPVLELTLERRLGRSAWEVCGALRQGEPAVYVGHGLLHENKLVIHPLHLTERQLAPLTQRLRDVLGGA